METNILDSTGKAVKQMPMKSQTIQPISQNPQSTEPNILDSMIAVAIILFILSMIVEKITQFIRRYSPFIKIQTISNNIGIRNVWSNVNKKPTGDSELDKMIEREIASLSFIIGLLIAAAFKVDLFIMLKEADPRTVLFWGNGNPPDFFSWETVWLTLSILLTGFFLSFGSKFFHDLIDTLLQVKNLKRKLVDEESYKVDTVQQLDEYLDKSYTDIIQTAIDQNRNLLQAADAVSPPMHGRIKREGRLTDCIDIHLSGQGRGAIPQAVTARLTNGKTVMVVVNVITEVSSQRLWRDRETRTPIEKHRLSKVQYAAG